MGGFRSGAARVGRQDQVQFCVDRSQPGRKFFVGAAGQITAKKILEVSLGGRTKHRRWHDTQAMSSSLVATLNTADTDTAERIVLDAEAEAVEAAAADGETADDTNTVTVPEVAPLLEPAVQKEPTAHAEDAPSAVVPPAAEDTTETEETAEASAEVGVEVAPEAAEVGLPESEASEEAMPVEAATPLQAAAGLQAAAHDEVEPEPEAEVVATPEPEPRPQSDAAVLAEDDEGVTHVPPAQPAQPVQEQAAVPLSPPVDMAAAEAAEVARSEEEGAA
eukprot:632061-Prymnesium_polylepis.1